MTRELTGAVKQGVTREEVMETMGTAIRLGGRALPDVRPTGRGGL